MRISVIGCGYLGAVHAASMAHLGHDVVGIDVDEAKIASLSAGRAPFFEPGLPEVLESAGASGRLRFTTDFAAARGKTLYDGICVACHGPEGKGDQKLGAPDLTDAAWLYGDSTEALRTTINDGRHGVMPAHGPLLGETRARLVAAYVWSLSHGNAAPAAAN